MHCSHDSIEDSNTNQLDDSEKDGLNEKDNADEEKMLVRKKYPSRFLSKLRGHSQFTFEMLGRWVIRNLEKL